MALTKPKKQAIPTSFCDNIVNHEKKECFFKYLFHVHYIMLNMLVQINEAIAKFFTLMVEGYLNKIMEFKCITCVIFGYFYSP
jgi:hypothetical protein